MTLPTPQTAAPLTPDLAFVVQLQSVGNPGPGELAGRVEHIASGQAERFASLTDLYTFMNKCALRAEPPKFMNQTAPTPQKNHNRSRK